VRRCQPGPALAPHHLAQAPITQGQHSSGMQLNHVEDAAIFKA
jgi:hypothetical protein